MIFRSLSLFVFLLSFSFLPTSVLAFAKINHPITISTLNLKWFGIGGTMWNHPEQEYRQQNIKLFIEQNLFDADIIVFTEVVVVEALEEIMADKMDCVSYEGAWSRHQHVVICYDKDLYRAEKYDEDYIIPEVALGSGGQRPAAQAKICKKKGGCFLQVIGLHLAAGNKTAKRSEQVAFVNEELAKQSRMLPTVITGDWNSYVTSQSQKDEDDIHIFEKILSKDTRGFRTITENILSYKGGTRARAYDHIVVSSDIKKIRTRGYEACKDEPDFSKTFIPYYSFKRHFTDHCPVTAKIQIK